MTCENCIKDNSDQNRWSDFKIAVPVALGFIVLFIFMQKIGLVNFINTSKMNIGSAFMIGLVASISSCMAVVGGIVLSMSTNFAKEGDKIKPQLLFHIGRLASFFFLGGMIGILGSTFQLGETGTILINFIIAAVLLILGINLLGVFPWIKKIQPTLPNFIGQKIHYIKNINHTLTPLFIGIITFFLPCGFTQSMQIYALSTGNFLSGAMIMFFFALGTLPVLSLLSFGSLAIHKKNASAIFLKVAGLIVIFFAVFSLISSLNTIGIRLPSFKNNLEQSNNVKVVEGIQYITLEVKGGYSPQFSVAKAGLPTILVLDTNNTYDCSLSVRIPSLNLNNFLPQTGNTNMNIGTSTAGIFKGSCGMGMYPFEVDFR